MPGLEVVLLDVGLHRHLVVERPERVLALVEVGQVGGCGLVRVSMQTEVPHEVDVVHEGLLAEVALERHVGLELAGEDLQRTGPLNYKPSFSTCACTCTVYHEMVKLQFVQRKTILSPKYLRETTRSSSFAW